MERDAAFQNSLQRSAQACNSLLIATHCGIHVKHQTNIGIDCYGMLGCCTDDDLLEVTIDSYRTRVVCSNHVTHLISQRNEQNLLEYRPALKGEMP